MKDRLEGLVIADTFVLQERIGAGGMALVYLARRVSDGLPVAVKILRNELAEDQVYVRHFWREGETLANLSHPNIVKIYGIGEQDDLFYMVMEYLPGQTLKQYIDQRGVLEVDEALDIAMQICNAMQHAHQNNVIHRDIKPQNVILSREEDGHIHVKVMDFGLAKPVTSATRTMMDGVLGTVQYISPEQARGDAAGKGCDIYSLGVLIYEMVTGTVPFKGDTPVAIALKHIQETPPPPTVFAPQLPRALEKIILKAMEKEPGKRYSSAKAMCRDLELVGLYTEGDYVQDEYVDDKTRMIDLKDHLPGADEWEDEDEAPAGKDPVAVGRIVRIFVAMVIVLGLLLTMFFIGNRMIQNSDTRVNIKMPSVVGQTEQDATHVLRDERNLRVNVKQERNDTVPAGNVIEQYPLPEAIIKEGETATLIVSIGPENVDVPDLKGMQLDAARTELERAGLEIGNVYEESNTYKPGYIFRQEPAAGESITAGEAVDIFVSAQDE